MRKIDFVDLLTSVKLSSSLEELDCLSMVTQRLVALSDQIIVGILLRDSLQCSLIVEDSQLI